jgi:hypothetical protein
MAQRIRETERKLRGQASDRKLAMDRADRELKRRERSEAGFASRFPEAMRIRRI